MNRTFAIGDIHGNLVHLEALLRQLPILDAQDTLLFIGDYLDRGPKSAEVVKLIRETLPTLTPAKIVALRGSHEDAWHRVLTKGWPEFVLPVGNGCLATLRSFTGGPHPVDEETPTKEEFFSMFAGDFFPEDVRRWLADLPAWYEDEHAIYVHAGLPRVEGRFVHPSELADPHDIIWTRRREFFTEYDGKRVVFGHTIADLLPQELSLFTPDDKNDLFFYKSAVGIDTGAGHGGFLTAIELPALNVYESRQALK